MQKTVNTGATGKAASFSLILSSSLLFVRLLFARFSICSLTNLPLASKQPNAQSDPFIRRK